MNKNLSNYVFTAKYAKHINGTRETYPQTIKRMLSMSRSLRVWKKR